jgi:hypothetical protein
MIATLVVFALEIGALAYWFKRGARRFGLRGTWWWIASALVFLVLGALSRLFLMFS